MNYNYLFSLSFFKYNLSNFDNCVNNLQNNYEKPYFIKSRKNLSILLVNSIFYKIFDFNDNIFSSFVWNKNQFNFIKFKHKYIRKISFINIQNNDLHFPMLLDFNQLKSTLHLNFDNTIIEVKDCNDVFVAKFFNHSINIIFNKIITKKFDIYTKNNNYFINICSKKDAFFYNIIYRFFMIIFIETKNYLFLQMILNKTDKIFYCEIYTKNYLTA